MDESNKELQSGDIGNEELDFGYILQYLLGNMMNDQAHRFFGEILQSMQESNHIGDSVDHTADITANARSIGVYMTKRGENLAFIEPHMPRESNKELQSGDIGNEELDFGYILQYLLGNMMNDQAHRFFGEILQSMQESDHCGDSVGHTE
ncbi:uncharacterized protein LOC128921583 [Zeugodacus cucurbitae]|uniref:uncharacterized protein LOC128921583 n=1 Tax=Zeugodacus cucurbitae TaxID=28588 RepID=UPI0023D9604F|nr:uncharacterized protein LOC128921583 [Zeugodacus cucurbitae]